MQLTVACVKLRIMNLGDVYGKTGLKAGEIKPIPDVLEVMFTGKPLPPFPIQISDPNLIIAHDEYDRYPNTRYPIPHYLLICFCCIHHTT